MIPCGPTSNSLIRLRNPNQITGVISTPPIGGIRRLEMTRKGSVGTVNKSQNLFLKFSFGYHVITIRIRKAIDSPAKRKPIEKWIIGSASIKIGVTKL